MPFDALLAILARHTSSTDSWFLFSHPARNYHLLHGRHHSYAGLPDDPNYWWPEDRAWCVVTDTDFDWAYVAGTAACIDEILAAPAIDAYPTRPENPAHSGMDVLNDPGAIIPESHNPLRNPAAIS